MVVWRENHAFHSGGLDHSVKKLTFPRQLSVLFPFSGIALEVAVFLGPRGGERSCHPPISNVYDYESYGVGSKFHNFDAEVGNCIIFSLAAILGF